jgi:hypothetical protein
MTRNTFRFIIPKPEGKRTVGKCRTEIENIEMVLKKTGRGMWTGLSTFSF